MIYIQPQTAADILVPLGEGAISGSPADAMDTQSLISSGFSIGPASDYRGFLMQLDLLAAVNAMGPLSLFFNEDVTPAHYQSSIAGANTATAKLVSNGPGAGANVRKIILVRGMTLALQDGVREFLSLPEWGSDAKGGAFSSVFPYEDSAHKWSGAFVAYPITRIRLREDPVVNQFRVGSSMKLWGIRRGGLT